MSEAVLLFARFVSSLGSVLTGAVVPLYLVQSNQESWIPYSLAGMAFGRIFGSFFLLPRTSVFPVRRILLFTSGAGFLSLLLFAFGFEALGSARSPLFFAVLSAVASVLGTVDDSVAHAALGDSSGRAKLVHLDSTLFTICRVIAPGLAAALLLLGRSRLSPVLVIDAMTYGAAFLIFWKWLKDEASESSFGTRLRFDSTLSVLKERPFFWGSLALIALGASTYNAGMVIHLKHSGLDLGAISSVMIFQNVTMVLTGLALSRWPTLAERRGLAAFLAAIGLGLIAAARSYPILVLGAVVMAVGMVIVLQGMRAKIAGSPAAPPWKRIQLGVMALVNSGAGIIGALLCSSLAPWVGWAMILGAGSILILSSGLAAFWAVPADPEAP